MSADLEFQRWVVTVLRADDQVGSMVEDRIYDRPPRERQFPCIYIGEGFESEVGEDGCEAYLLIVRLYAVDKERGFVRAKRIAAATVKALAAARDSGTPTLDTFELSNLEHRENQSIRNMDGGAVVIMSFEVKLVKEN